MTRKMESPIGLDMPGKKMLLMGNEAIARGAVEADVRVVAGYPGTPATEIIDTLARVGDRLGIYVEWSINEKVALDVTAGAALSGLRSMACMKNVGLNVAADALMTLVYVGIRGGHVVVVADDPGAHSSGDEQDCRFYTRILEIPMLEPADPEEARDMVIDAFAVSEKIELPVLVRPTTRVSHVRGNVTLGKILRQKRKADFKKGPSLWVTSGINALERHRLHHEKQPLIRRTIGELPYNRLVMNEKNDLGVVASGVSYNYAKEAIEMLDIEDKVSILKIGTSYPLPEDMIGRIVQEAKRVLILEELEPYVENYVRSIAQGLGAKTEIRGKLTGDIPETGELNPSIVCDALARILGRKFTARLPQEEQIVEAARMTIPRRSVGLCPGCSHRAALYALQQAVKKVAKGKFVAPGDIGCYCIAAFPPYKVLDTNTCMGASIGMGCGLAKAGLQDPIIAVIGDSTFFHAGIPPLINSVYTNADMTILILDNLSTAMTGHQPHPGTGTTATGKSTKKISIEEVVRGCGVEFLEKVDPYDLKTTQDTIEKAMEFKGPAVVVARRTCTLMETRELRRKGIKIPPLKVNTEICTKCGVCTSMFGCPAIVAEGDEVRIDEILCVGCGVCADVCPNKAIVRCESI